MATELTLVADRGEESPDTPDALGTADAMETLDTLVASEAASPPLDFVAHPRPGRLVGIYRRLRREERGAVTAEYAIVILAGVAFAGLLVAIMRSSEVREMLVGLVENALGSASP